MDTFEYKYRDNNAFFRYAKGESLMRGDEIHPFYEILYYMGGDATLLTEKFESKLNNNSLIIIPKECYHKFKILNQNNYTRLFIQFSLTADTELTYNKIFSEIRVVTPNNYILSVLNRITEVLSEICYAESKNNLLKSALPMLLAELSATSFTVQPTLRKDEHLITKCINFIDNRLNTPLFVSDIAREMGVSVSTLHLCFKDHLGISIYKYITEKRLDLAAKLLSDTEYSVSQIAELVGIGNPPYFSELFKKKNGVTPKKYRDKEKKRK